MSDTPFSDNTSSTADVVTAVDFTGTTLTLTKQAGDDLTTTISSSPQVVTALTYNAENDDKLKLTQSAGQGSFEVTIPSGGLPYAFAQTDDTEIIDDTWYWLNDNAGITFVGGAEVTQLSKTITPTSSSQKVAIHVTIYGEWENYPYECGVIIKRTIGTDSPSYLIPTQDGIKTMLTGTFCTDNPNSVSNFSTPEVCNFVHIDSPETTSTITYVPQVVARTKRKFYLNRSLYDGNSSSSERGFSTMTLECKNV